MFETLLIPGSIPALAMRRCVLRKTLYSEISLGPDQLPGLLVVVDKFDERLTN